MPIRHPELDLPRRVQDWTDAHVVRWLVAHGSEGVGDLILGRDALDRYLRDEHGPARVDAAARERRYSELAALSIAGAPVGSSAQGEHPKFAAECGNRLRRYATRAVTVPPPDRPAAARLRGSARRP